MNKLCAILSSSALAVSLMGSANIMAFEPLATPDVDDMVFYDDEENTAQEVELGRILFFDTRLSINRNQSCATCHDPNKGFGDGLAKGKGTMGNALGRNTPHIYNLGWSSIFMWDGREPTLESQALGPIKSSDEMMLPITQLLSRLNEVPAYRKLFKEAYGVDTIGEEEVGRAMAAFERTIIVDDTPFDRYLAGDKKAMTPAAVRGLKLYQDKARCVLCHDGANFTDDSFHSLGMTDGDIGRAKISGDKTQTGAFKTPGLRNTEFTAPYMHDGSLATLMEVIEFYDQGGGGAKHTDPLVKPLKLTQTEKEDLVAFLKALSQPLEIAVPDIPK